MQKADPCFIPLDQSLRKSLIPAILNSPFAANPPEICKIAAADLSQYLIKEQENWPQNFGLDSADSRPVKGKMFGVLVVENKNGQLGYLATFSGKFPGINHPEIFVPSLFDVSHHNEYVSAGMIGLTKMSKDIKTLEAGNKQDTVQAEKLREERKSKSQNLQDYLFRQYDFLNEAGDRKNILDIFQDYSATRPPSGAGECAAPKLLHYAYKNGLKALAIGEFWWGRSSKPVGREHREFYPACENKCRPILDYMID